MAEDDEGETTDSEVPLQDLADAVAERRKGSINLDSTEERQSTTSEPSEPQRSRSSFDAPLQELANVIANRRAADLEADRQKHPAAGDETDEMADGPGSVSRGQRARTHVTDTVNTLVDQLGTGAKMDTSPFLFTVHYAVTGGSLLGAAAVYLAADLGLIPPQFWTLVMPPLIIGVIGALPILSRWLGLWRPEELR